MKKKCLLPQFLINAQSIIFYYLLSISVVVTGSSSGIGMNYAKEFAKRGMNVVLMSNEEDQLNAVGKEIGKYHFQ